MVGATIGLAGKANVLSRACAGKDLSVNLVCRALRTTGAETINVAFGVNCSLGGTVTTRYRVSVIESGAR